MDGEAKAAITMSESPLQNWRKKILPHWELFAALACGLLIAAGWILDKTDRHFPAIAMYLLSYFIGGFAKGKEGIGQTIREKQLNVEMLMIFAAAGAALIGYWLEGALLIFIFAISGALETYTMNKSQKEISSLMELQPEQAVLLTNGQERILPVSQLKIGDQILIKPGERVPADGIIKKGKSHLNEATITGESLPVLKEEKEEVFAGTLNVNGALIVEVTKKSTETLFQKIIELIQSAKSEKSPAQLFIEKFEGYYVKAVLAIVALMMFLPHFLLGWSWQETFYRAMILLVVASPCALVASVTPATLAAISNGARRGILFKGGIHLENLKYIKAIAFDKTGTLTTGIPEITNVLIKDGYSKEEVLTKTASIERHSTHPLAKTIVNYAKNHGIQPFYEPENVENIAGYGIKAFFGNEMWKIGKKEFVQNKFQDDLFSSAGERFEDEGKTVVYIQKADETIGVIALKDNVRKETKDAIKRLKEKGIFTVMITGDNRQTAQTIKNESSVDHFVAECLPDKKVDELKKLKKKFGQVAMVGDGVNDAPALAIADVGISMGDGSGVALDTADVVLMKNDLPRIADAVDLSERMNRIVKQNIIFSVSMILLLILTNFLQMIDLPLGVIGHEGSTILVILNGLRLLR